MLNSRRTRTAIYKHAFKEHKWKKADREFFNTELKKLAEEPFNCKIDEDFRIAEHLIFMERVKEEYDKLDED